MWYYSGLLVYILLLAVVTAQTRDRKKGRKIFFILSCLGIILFQGYRSFSVGTDLAAYIPAFSKIGISGLSNLRYANFEPGYVLLNKLLYRAGLDERGFLIAIAAIVQVPIFFTMYRYSEFPLFSILWYFAFGNFIMTFSGLRQSIAMSLCFAFYYFIKERKLLSFCAMVAVAGFFHKSALFCLILYPAYYIKLDKRKFFRALGAVFAVFMFRSQIFRMMSALYYGESKDTTATGAYTMFAAYLLIFILSFFGQADDPDFLGFRNIVLLLVLIYAFASVHDYVTRIGYPLSLYVTLFVPKLMKSYRVVPVWLYKGICCTVCIVCFYYFLGGLNTLPFSFG